MPRRLVRNEGGKEITIATHPRTSSWKHFTNIFPCPLVCSCSISVHCYCCSIQNNNTVGGQYPGQQLSLLHTLVVAKFLRPRGGRSFFSRMWHNNNNQNNSGGRWLVVGKRARAWMYTSPPVDVVWTAPRELTTSKEKTPAVVDPKGRGEGAGEGGFTRWKSIHNWTAQPKTLLVSPSPLPPNVGIMETKIFFHYTKEKQFLTPAHISPTFSLDPWTARGSQHNKNIFVHTYRITHTPA